MTRSCFLKNLIGLYGVAALPLERVKQYERIYLLQSFVRGFQYYEGPRIIGEINNSGVLELVREPDNIHDSQAIALHFNRRKIGYLPRESNEVLSVLMDADLIQLQAELTHIQPDAADWEKLYVAVYVLKEIENRENWARIEPYTVLETPRYHSLKSKNDRYTRVYFDDDEEEVFEDDFYETIVKNSSGNDVYELIHGSFADAEEMEEAFSQSKLLINEHRTPPSVSVQELELTLDEVALNIEGLFGEDGFVVANVNEIATMLDQISSFEKILDKQGRHFYEVIFKSNTL